jgi:hypothetical protein
LQLAVVEWVVWINSIIKNKPNFPHFSTQNDDFAKKQTQFKPNTKPILAYYEVWQSQNKPEQSQKMNAFTCKMSLVMIYYDVLMTVTTYKDGLCVVNHIRTLIRAGINTGQKWSISKTSH